jgi:thermitase
MRVALVLILALLPAGPHPVAAAMDHAPDRLLVKLRPGVAAAALPAFGRARPDLGIASVDALLANLGAHSIERLLPAAPASGRERASSLGLDRWSVVRFADGTDLEAARIALAASADVETVEFDGQGEGGSVIPNDPSFATQWHLRNLSTPGADIHATDGWSWTTGTSAVIVGILDSGGDWDHPDLASRIWSNPGEIPGNGVDDDGNGYVDDVRGWDFVNNDNNPMDDHGHGTNVSGIVGAATNNGQGVAGVNWNCRLLLAKNLDATNSGFYSWWTASIYYAANAGARVLNMSEGGLSFSTPMRDAVDYANGLGALVCVAMMNANSSTPYYPVNYTNTIAVGATNSSDRRAVPFCWGGGSSYGSHIELVAPGDLIYSTLWNDTYGYFCGTSQATPQVSAAAALVWAVYPSLTNAMVRSLLLSNADDQVGDPLEDTPGFDIYYGYGRLNLDRTLSAATALAVEPGAPARSLDVAIAPNPVVGLAALRYRLPAEGAIEWALYDLAGRRVLVQTRHEAGAGEGTAALDVAGLASGVYTLRFTVQGGGSVMRRVAIVR